MKAIRGVTNPNIGFACQVRPTCGRRDWLLVKGAVSVIADTLCFLVWSTHNNTLHSCACCDASMLQCLNAAMPRCLNAGGRHYVSASCAIGGNASQYHTMSRHCWRLGPYRVTRDYGVTMQLVHGQKRWGEPPQPVSPQLLRTHMLKRQAPVNIFTDSARFCCHSCCTGRSDETRRSSRRRRGCCAWRPRSGSRRCWWSRARSRA